jgi:hypothetical protein
MKNKLYTFDQHLKESLTDPEFKKAWEETELFPPLDKDLFVKKKSLHSQKFKN